MLRPSRDHPRHWWGPLASWLRRADCPKQRQEGKHCLLPACRGTTKSMRNRWPRPVTTRLLLTTKTKTKSRRGSSRRKTASPQKPRHATSGLPKPAGRREKNPAIKEATKPRSAKSEGLAHTSEERRHGEKLISSNKEKNVAVVQGPKKATATMATDQSIPPTPTPSGDILVNGGGEQPGNSMRLINPQILKHPNKGLRSACPRSPKTNQSFTRQKALGVSRGEQRIPMDHQKAHP